MTKLVRDCKAEKKAHEKYRRDLDEFLAGKRDKPPHYAWVEDVIYSTRL